MLDEQKVRGVIEAYVEGWRTKDRALWSSLFAEDARLVDPVGTPAHEGKAACVAFFDGVQKMPFSFAPSVHRIAVCGDRALLLFRMEATGADGNGYFVEAADIFMLNAEGLITSLEAYWDKGCQGRIKASA